MKKTMNQYMYAVMAVAVALGALPAVATDAPVKKSSTAQTKSTTQKSYPSPEEAAKALYDVVKTHDTKSIVTVLGQGSTKALYTGDEVADRQMRERFLAAYDKSLKIERDGDVKATLLLGEKDSPFPFPLVKGSKGWRFDTKAGTEEIINRRIGENELFVIKACLAYGDAQREYAEHDHDGDGLLEYAQKFYSSEGKQDGLYWKTSPGEPSSPFGPLYARATKEGYSLQGKGTPYHGYYYRILTSQGKDAPGGAYNYLVKGNMFGGYALVAYPSSWGSSGVMTFICSHNDVVYQKNLGPNTAAVASKLKIFNPGAGWKKAE